MSSYKKKKYSIPKYNIKLDNINTTISDSIQYYDIENKGLLNLIKIKNISEKSSKSKSKSKRKSESKSKSKRNSTKIKTI
tara:strand:+ start:2391 stop:2630 length:240 start_codon:yes stop_codon:yes gene_type:complete